VTAAPGPGAASLSALVDTATPILVVRRSLGPLQHAVLAVSRSAGRLGIPVYAVLERPHEPAGRSRYLCGGFELQPGLPDEDWLERLVELGRGIGRPVLLPIDDAAAVTVGDHEDRLVEHFLLAPQPPGVRRRLSSKRELHALCLQLGLATPASSFPVSEEELVVRAEELGYPVVLKRAESWFPPRFPGAPSVAIVHTRAELTDAYARMESDVHPQLMVQEYVPGPSDSVWMFNGCFDADSRLLCGFTGRKLRQRGPDAGPTSLGVCARNEEVVDAARRLMAEVGYRGIVDMGFRYDGRDGSYKLLDVNPRLGSTFPLFTSLGGIDVVRALHLDLTGRRVPASETADGRTWLDEPHDFGTALLLVRRGSLTPRAWLSSLRGVDELAWWARDDLRPFRAMALRLVPYAIGGLLRRLRA
jgi:D-aspartate ligase